MIRPARHLILLWMQLTGFRGLTFPWAVYIHPDRLDDMKLIQHEMTHVEQMKRDGTLRFYVRYLWWSLRYGYKKNPYEVEARAAETHAHL